MGSQPYGGPIRLGPLSGWYDHTRRRIMKAPGRAAALALAASTLVASGAIAQSPTGGGDLGPATGDVTALMIGFPDQDGVDADGNPTVGIGYVEQLFNSTHPDIHLHIVNIPWGSGSTGYGPKTESMIQANEACIYTMPGYFDYAHQGAL